MDKVKVGKKVYYVHNVMSVESGMTEEHSVYAIIMKQKPTKSRSVWKLWMGVAK